MRGDEYVCCHELVEIIAVVEIHKKINKLVEQLVCLTFEHTDDQMRKIALDLTLLVCQLESLPDWFGLEMSYDRRCVPRQDRAQVNQQHENGTMGH